MAGGIAVTGLAPATVYITAGLLFATGLAWIAAKLAGSEKAAKFMAITFAAVTVICVSFLILDKMVNVSYAKGLYAAILVTASVGIATGFALRRLLRS